MYLYVLNTVIHAMPKHLCQKIHAKTYTTCTFLCMYNIQCTHVHCTWVHVLNSINHVKTTWAYLYTCTMYNVHVCTMYTVHVHVYMWSSLNKLCDATRRRNSGQRGCTQFIGDYDGKEISWKTDVHTRVVLAKVVVGVKKTLRN